MIRQRPRARRFATFAMLAIGAIFATLAGAPGQRASAAVVAPPASIPAARPLTGARSTPGTSSPLALLALGALGVVGAVAWRRRRLWPAGQDLATLEVVSQTSLGGRARAVWLRAGERQIVIAVTPQAVQVVDRWPEPRAGLDLSRRYETANPAADGRPRHPARTLARRARRPLGRVRPHRLRGRASQGPR